MLLKKKKRSLNVNKFTKGTDGVNLGTEVLTNLYT